MTRSTDRSQRAGRARAAAVLATGALLCAWLGCGESEPATKTPTAAKPPMPTAPPPDASAIGDVDMGTEGLPEGFPTDLPLYPGSEPTRWMAAAGPGSLVVFDAEATPQNVFDHFQQELPAAGWVIASASQSNPKNWSVIASKGGRNARISIAPSAAGAQYGIAVAAAD